MPKVHCISISNIRRIKIPLFFTFDKYDNMINKSHDICILKDSKLLYFQIYHFSCTVNGNLYQTDKKYMKFSTIRNHMLADGQLFVLWHCDVISFCTAF